MAVGLDQSNGQNEYQIKKFPSILLDMGPPFNQFPSIFSLVAYSPFNQIPYLFSLFVNRRAHLSFFCFFSPYAFFLAVGSNPTAIMGSWKLVTIWDIAFESLYMYINYQVIMRLSRISETLWKYRRAYPWISNRTIISLGIPNLITAIYIE